MVDSMAAVEGNLLGGSTCNGICNVTLSYSISPW